jgi:hypothetical protein
LLDTRLLTSSKEPNSHALSKALLLSSDDIGQLVPLFSDNMTQGMNTTLNYYF